MNIEEPRHQPSQQRPDAWTLVPGEQVSRLTVAVDDRLSAQTGTQAGGNRAAAGGDAAAVPPEPTVGVIEVEDRPYEPVVADKAIEHLTAEECTALLSEHHFGRLAFIDTVGVLPLITPVNYLFHDGAVAFRTDPGSKLPAAILGAPVAFEIDGLDKHNRTGWSVVVRGHAEEVTSPAELAQLRQTPLLPWAPGVKGHYVTVQARQLSGRRITLINLPSNWWG